MDHSLPLPSLSTATVEDVYKLLLLAEDWAHKMLAALSGTCSHHLNTLIGRPPSGKAIKRVCISLECMRWMDGWMDGWDGMGWDGMGGCLGGWVGGREGWVGGWMDGSMDGWMDGWMDAVMKECTNELHA